MNYSDFSTMVLREMLRHWMLEERSTRLSNCWTRYRSIVKCVDHEFIKNKIKLIEFELRTRNEQRT